jgi:hypothetical protein
VCVSWFAIAALAVYFSVISILKLESFGWPMRWPMAMLVVFRMQWSCLVLVLGMLPLVLMPTLGRDVASADGPASYDPG